jgi:hypothetical protein
MRAEAVAPEKDGNAMDIEEDVEPYERGMSPVLIYDIIALPPEEREIDIVDELDDRKQLVSCLWFLTPLASNTWPSSRNVAL